VAERWQEYEESYIRQVSHYTYPLEIAKKLDRSERSVLTKARQLGVKKIKGINRRKPKGKFTLSRHRHLIPYPDRWSQQMLALFFTHTNEQIAELTGLAIDEVGDRRLLENLRRNGWLHKEP